MSAKCYKCGGATQPAALNPKALWCTICAEELNQSGGPMVGIAPNTAQALVAKGEPAENLPNAANEPQLSRAEFIVGQSKASPSFRVTIGSVSFTVSGRTELSVGKSKVVIELL